MDPRIRKHQLCNEEASITSSKRVPSFQPKQQVEGEWDADSWHQGEVTELFRARLNSKIPSHIKCNSVVKYSLGSSKH